MMEHSGVCPRHRRQIKCTNRSVESSEVDSMRMFTCKKLRYIWNEKTKMFSRVKSIGPGLPTSTLHRPDAQQGLAGLSALQQRKRYSYLKTKRKEKTPSSIS